MNDVLLHKALAEASSGYVMAPAGCGKTEAIVQAVKDYCIGKQLILTHTHAGVGALKKRFKDNQVSQSKYHIETISGWALGWVSRYPKISKFSGSLPIPKNKEWSLVYEAAQNLLNEQFVQWVIKNSYSGVIVDEYQDCSVPMHNLIITLKNILPCRILGDPLQGIFDFNERLVNWSDVESQFTEIGQLITPHRWIRSNNKALGDWLIQVRTIFLANNHPDYNSSPIICQSVNAANKAGLLQQLSRDLEGSICVIGPKHGKHGKALKSALLNAGFLFAEPNDLPDLRKFLAKIFVTNLTTAQLAKEVLQFISNSFAKFDKYKLFVSKLLNGTIKRNPKKPKQLKLFKDHNSGYSHLLMLDLINYFLSEKIKCNRYESLFCLKRILEQHLKTQEDISMIFANEIAYRKIIGKGRPNRCVGTTLLLKGLEFDHAIILYNPNDVAWKNLKDVYVALSRGCKSVYIINS